MKIKETIKTIILTGLVVSTLVLTSRIWISEELWPEGYNSFLSGAFSFFKKNDAQSLDLSQIYYPKQILVSKNNRSEIISTIDSKYEEINVALKGHIKTALLNGKISGSDDEEYKKACNTDSLFIGLYSYISFEMLADYYNAEITNAILDINHVKNILFCPSSDNSGFLIYAKNSETGKVYKISVEEDVSKLQGIIDKTLQKVPEGTVAASFAFENNFDKKNENEKDKILLDSYMLINLNESYAPSIVPASSNIFNGDAYITLSKYFGVNANTARRFTDTNGTVNLVENFGTIKFHTDGLLEYISMDGGIELNGDVSSTYDAVKNAGEFTEGVNNLISLPENNSYVFAGVSESSDNTYTISFDILYKGVPVVLNREVSNKEQLTHPIEIKIKGGKIISYRQLFISFKNKGQETMIPDMISVLDKFYLTFDIKNNPDVSINDIYSVYYYDTINNTATQGNAVLLSNGKVVMVEWTLKELKQYWLLYLSL